MKLTGVQYEQFREALLSAFPSHANLSQMVRIQFNKNLDVIAMGANLGEIAFNLIGVAEAEGWTDLLLRGAYEARPNNPELKAFAAQLERNQRLENFFPSQSLKSPVASSASNNSPKFEETLGENFLKKQELITLLLACPIMANRASRYNLLRGVRKGEFVTKIARNDVDLIEAENIVNTLLDYAGALEELITLVRRADSGTKALQALETFIRTLV